MAKRDAALTGLTYWLSSVLAYTADSGRKPFAWYTRVMPANLPNELRTELAANPGQAVPVVDEQTDQTYYLVGEDFLFDGAEQDPASRDRLLELLREGDAGGEVSGEEGRERMRATIDTLRRPAS